MLLFATGRNLFTRAEHEWLACLEHPVQKRWGLMKADKDKSVLCSDSFIHKKRYNQHLQRTVSTTWLTSLKMLVTYVWTKIRAAPKTHSKYEEGFYDFEAFIKVCCLMTNKSWKWGPLYCSNRSSSISKKRSKSQVTLRAQEVNRRNVA